MKKFYSKINELLKKQLNELTAFTARQDEIKQSTAAHDRKDADLIKLKAEYNETTQANKAAYLDAISEKRTELETQLSTWKHSENPALTNLLLVLNSSGSNLSASQVATMAEPFKDDFISITAIKAAAKNAGINEEGLTRLQSDLGDNPTKVLTAFENRSFNLFSGYENLANTALAESIRYSDRGVAGEDISGEISTGGSIMF